MKFGKGYVVGEDTGDSVCSYGGKLRTEGEFLVNLDFYSGD